MRRSRAVDFLTLARAILVSSNSCSAYLFTGCCCFCRTNSIQRVNASRGSTRRGTQLLIHKARTTKNRWNQLLEGRHRTRVKAAAAAELLPSEEVEETSLRKGLPGYAEDWQLREALGQCELDILADVPVGKIAGRVRDEAAAGYGAATRFAQV